MKLGKKEKVQKNQRYKANPVDAIVLKNRYLLT